MATLAFIVELIAALLCLGAIGLVFYVLLDDQAN